MHLPNAIINNPVSTEEHGTSFPRISKIAIAFVTTAVLAFVLLFASGAFKTPQERLAEFSGTWYMEALGNDSRPVTSIVGSHLATNATGINEQMRLGVIGERAQLVVLGAPKDYTVELVGDHMVLSATDDDSSFEASIVFGKLVLSDRNAGTSAIYSKVSDTYEWQERIRIEDSQALLETAEEIAQMAGAGTSQMGEYVSAEEIAYQLGRADPAAVQQVLSNVDMTAIITGHPENAIDIQDPAVKEVASAVDVDAIFENHPEAANYATREDVENVIERYQAGEFHSISEIESIFQSGEYEQSLMSSNMQEQG